MPQTILGIDLGSYSVKIAKITRSFKSFEFVGFYERRIQYNEVLSPEESTAIALQGLLDDHHLDTENVVCGFPGQHVSSRLVTFPFSSRKKIDQTIQFEMETYIPFDMETVHIDYGITWSTKEASRILVAYVQKGEMAKYLSMLQGVGVDPRVVSVEGIELVHLVNLGMVPPESHYALIDIGHEKTTIAICHGKNVSFVRALSLAGNAITQRIAKKLGVTLHEAERMKIEMGSLPIDLPEEIDDITRDVVAAIKEVIDELLLHIRQTFFSYRDEEGESIEGVFLSGGSSRLPGIDSYLSDALKQNVAYINCTDFHFSRLEHAEAHRHVIPQALALALRGVAPGGFSSINLRKGDFAFKGDVEQFGGSMRQIAIALGSIVFLSLTYFSITYYSLHSKLDQIESEAHELIRQALPDAPPKALESTKSGLAILKSREATLSDRMKKLQALQGISPLDVLKTISEKVPPRTEVKFDVEKLNVAPARAVLSGYTDSFEAVDRIKQSLEKVNLFRSVTSGNVRKGVKDEVKFDLSFELVTTPEEGI